MKSSYNVLFSCAGNSAHSIMPEAIMNGKGVPRFRAFSAGSHPSGIVRPEALRQLESAGLSTADARSKSWDEFALPVASSLNFIFTVCDSTANAVCPIWPDQPMTTYWGVPDPAAVQGSQEEIDRAFRTAFSILERRISLFLCLPLAALDQMALQRNLDDIGHQ